VRPAACARMGPQKSFGDAGIDGALEDDDGAFLQALADDLAGGSDGAEIGLVARVDRGRNGDDDDIARSDVGRVVGQGQGAGAEHGGGDLVGAIDAVLQLGDALCADVVADGGKWRAMATAKGKPT